MQKYKINNTAILLLVILHQVINFLWYSPYLFAAQWMSYNKLSPEKIQFLNLYILIISVIASLFLSYAMAWLFIKTNVGSGLKGMIFAFFLWFCFSFLIVLSHAVLGATPKGLIYIDTGRDLVIFLLTGFILGSWTKQKEYF